MATMDSDVRSYQRHGVRVVELAEEGRPLESDRDAVDAIAAASAHRPDILVIPKSRLGEDFFRLRTGIAGQVIQKFLTYRLRVVILGDISAHVAESRALRDFVHESNSGSHVWFARDADELDRRLQPGANTP